MRISLRAKAIASLIKDNSKIIDVGCDHALLDIYLVKNKKIPKIIASDINPKALAKGINNINKYQVQHQIITRQGDGLATIDDDINTVIMAGLGGHTIANILIRQKHLLTNIRQLIIQPNNHIFLVRKTLNLLGYIIDHELLIKERNIIYTIMSFKKGNLKYTYKELYFGPILFKNISPLMREMYHHKIAELKSIYNQLSIKHWFKKIKILFEINYIKRYLK